MKITLEILKSDDGNLTGYPDDVMCWMVCQVVYPTASRKYEDSWVQKTLAVYTSRQAAKADLRRRLGG